MMLELKAILIVKKTIGNIKPSNTAIKKFCFLFGETNFALRNKAGSKTLAFETLLKPLLKNYYETNFNSRST